MVVVPSSVMDGSDYSMNWLRACPLVLIVAVLWFLLSAVRDDRLRVTVENARIQFEPGYIRVRVRVEPDPQNRALAIGLVGPEFETSSLEELPGDRARITRWVSYRDIPAGEYAVLAEVLRADGSTTLAQDRLQVLGRGF